jgi:hypothetical protein
MKTTMVLAVSFATLALTSSARGDPGGQGPGLSPAQPAAEGVIQDWPEASRLIAQVMIEEYGEPAEVSSVALVWFNNGPWKKTLVFRSPPANWSSSSEADVLQQVVSYHVPLNKFGELVLFDTRLTMNQARRELSFRSDSEKLNFLALNLAHDIIIGEKDAREARLFFDVTAELAQAGKSSPYTEGLRFQTERPLLTTPY